jgi:hypothetical protein
MLYTINITETLHKTITLKAKDYDTALEKVRKMYDNQEIVLSADDFVGKVIW